MEQQQEWQPKWGEEVEASDQEINWHKVVYVGKHPNEKSEMPYLVWFKVTNAIVSYKHIRPIPPKPKTLREEVWDWLKQEGCSLSCDSRIKLSHIIDRHEKGATNA
jgi:hypothetical protein